MEQVPKLASVRELTVVEMHGRQLSSFKVDDQGDALLHQAKHRNRQIEACCQWQCDRLSPEDRGLQAASPFLRRCMGARR